MSLAESWQRSTPSPPLKGLPALRERKLPQVRGTSVTDQEVSDRMWSC